MKFDKNILLLGGFGILLIIMILNYVSISSLQTKVAIDRASVSNQQVQTASAVDSSSQTAQTSGAISFSDIAPKGIPAIYGKELGVSYDDISASTPDKADATIKKLGQFDDKIKLEGDDLKRYIRVAGNIACEYCCGAQTLIDANGNAACGCAHSYAMRGLGKYLIKYHAKEYTDVQLLEEMAKWKVLFFPGPLTAKANVMAQKRMPLNYVTLASNQYRGVETQPVGQTSQAATNPGVSGKSNTPGQVGGC